MAGTHSLNPKFPKQPLSGHMMGWGLTSPPWRQNPNPIFGEIGLRSMWYNVVKRTGMVQNHLSSVHPTSIVGLDKPVPFLLREGIR